MKRARDDTFSVLKVKSLIPRIRMGEQQEIETLIARARQSQFVNIRFHYSFTYGNNEISNHSCCSLVLCVFGILVLRNL